MSGRFRRNARGPPPAMLSPRPRARDPSPGRVVRRRTGSSKSAGDGVSAARRRRANSRDDRRVAACEAPDATGLQGRCPISGLPLDDPRARLLSSWWFRRMRGGRGPPPGSRKKRRGQILLTRTTRGGRSRSCSRDPCRRGQQTGPLQLFSSKTDRPRVPFLFRQQVPAPRRNVAGTHRCAAAASRRGRQRRSASGECSLGFSHRLIANSQRSQKRTRRAWSVEPRSERRRVLPEDLGQDIPVGASGHGLAELPLNDTLRPSLSSIHGASTSLQYAPAPNPINTHRLPSCSAAG